MTEKRIIVSTSTAAPLSSELAGPIVYSTPPAQKFFADLASAARAPGYGDQHRSFVTNLLLRAQEAGIYTPEAT